MEGNHFLTAVHHLLPFVLLVNDETEELLDITFRFPLCQFVDGVIENGGQLRSVLLLEVPGIPSQVDGGGIQRRLRIIMALAEQFRAVKREIIAENIEDLFPGFDEVVDQLRVNLLGSCNSEPVTLTEDVFSDNLLVHVRIPREGKGSQVTSYKLIQPVDGCYLTPTVRGLVKASDDVGNSRIATLAGKEVLNFFLSFRHHIHRTILLRANRTTDLLLQAFNRRRGAGGLDVGGEGINVLEVFRDGGLVPVSCFLVSQQCRIEDLLSGDDGARIQYPVERRLNAAVQKLGGTLTELVVRLGALLRSVGRIRFQVFEHFAIVPEIIFQLFVVLIHIHKIINHLLGIVTECEQRRRGIIGVNLELDQQIGICLTDDVAIHD